ncbi:hypothetical protein K505DRAFT_230644 [Melanomma pulvis-pyrius CBS 109.77]|uniref:Uncharacterized protein n=1 Tax=Melanomma pulvis-pyrius CBS 109.77 TaxID=1314802 RepID=A0A6A6XT21_9PLEO|nr:hypothetical protein K505DRAFT_230644 [Melanomma pulvis-pyrius CBS 109.77]
MLNQTSDTDGNTERQITIVRTAGIIQQALGQYVERETCQSDVAIPNTPSIIVVGLLCSKIIHLGPSSSSLVGSFRAQQEWVSSWKTHYPASQDLELLREKDERYTSRILGFSDEDITRIKDIRDPVAKAWYVSKGSERHIPDASYAISHEYPGREQTKSVNPRICLGTNHAIAMVPPGAELGDVIIRFWHCSAAIIMRPPPDNSSDATRSSFRMIGRADVAEDMGPGELEGDYWGKMENKSRFSARVYVELDFGILQSITAMIST